MFQKIRIFRDQRGATAIEYGLVLAVVGLAASGAMTGIGTRLISIFTALTTAMVNTG